MLCYVFLIYNQILYLPTLGYYGFSVISSQSIDFTNLHDCFNGVFTDKFLFAHKDKKVK